MSRFGVRVSSVKVAFRLLQTVAVAVCLCAARVGSRAQDSPPSPRELREWFTQKSIPPSAFLEFKPAFEQVLKEKGHCDLEHETFHFVVLFNTAASVNGVPKQRMSDIYYGLLRHYLVADGTVADKVSFVPFQLLPRQEAVYNRAFEQATAREMYNAVPEITQPDGELKGGNDVERALLAARRAVDTPDNAIYLVLSNNEMSQAPQHRDGSDASDALMISSPNFETQLAAAGLVRAGKDRITRIYTKPDGTRTEIPIYWRVFLPASFKKLDTLSGKSRSEIVAVSTAPATDEPLTDPNKVKPPINSGTMNKPANGKKPDEMNLGAIAAIILVVVLVGGIIGYRQYLMQPRSVSIGLKQPDDLSPTMISQPVRVVYGKPQMLGKEAPADVCLPGLPADTGTIAQIKVTPSGSVEISSEGWKLEDSPVTVAQGQKQQIRMAPGHLADPMEFYELVVERI